MTREVGDGHFSSENEGDWAREEPEEHERPADHLDHACQTEERHERNAGPRLSGGESEELLAAVRYEEKRDDDPEDALEIRCPSRGDRTTHQFASCSLSRQIARIARARRHDWNEGMERAVVGCASEPTTPSLHEEVGRVGQ